MMSCCQISIQLCYLAWWDADQPSVKFECIFTMIKSNLTASWHQDFNSSGSCQTSYCLWMKVHIIMTTFHDMNPFIVFRESNYQTLKHSSYYNNGYNSIIRYNRTHLIHMGVCKPLNFKSGHPIYHMAIRAQCTPSRFITSWWLNCLSNHK